MPPGARGCGGGGGPGSAVSPHDITVGIATCGRPSALARCLRGLSGQTKRPNEVLVVDQSPSDDARAAAASCDLAEVRYLEQPRLGLSASRNMALSEAAGAVLAVTDDDCVPEPSWLAMVAAALERDPAPAAVTGQIRPLGDPLPGTFAVSSRGSTVAVDHVGRSLPWAVGSGGNFTASVEVLRRCGGWDERLGTGSRGQAAEDADLIYRLLLDGHRIRYEPEAVVRHERQTRARRIASRWSYGYGIGAMCGLWLARRDSYAVRMLGGYSRLHAGPLLVELRRRNRQRTAEHARALASLPPGVLHGLRVARDPASSMPARSR